MNTKERYQTDPEFKEYHKQQSRKWHAANRDRVNELQRSRYAKRTPEEIITRKLYLRVSRIKKRSKGQCSCRILEGNLVEVCPMHYSMYLNDSSIKWELITDKSTATKIFGVSAIIQTVNEKHQQ